MDTQALEQAIGLPSGQGDHNAVPITDATKPLIRDWLVAKGFDRGRADSARGGTLAKAYAIPAYLRAILSRGDYNPAVAKTEPARPAQAERAYTPVAETATQEYVPLPHMPASQADALATLGVAIQAIAGQAINEQRVIELIQEHAPTRETVRELVIIQREAEKITLPEEPRHKLFPDILSCVMANIPVMLVGPAGAGKTTLGHQISTALELSFAHTGAVSSRYELSGYNDAQGNYQPTAFRLAYEHGGLFLFDEIDGSDPAALLWCNTAIANGVCAFPDGNVERHENFRLIAAANTFGRGADRVYVGRNPLDGASLDRFVVVDFDYDQELERKVFGDTDWTKRVQNVRAAVAKLKLRHVVSPRATDYGRRLLASGMAQDRVEHMTIWKGIEPDQIAKVEQAIIDGGF